MQIDLEAITKAVTIFSSSSNSYAHNDFGITDARAKWLMESGDNLVTDFLEIEEDDENYDWTVSDVVCSMIEFIRLNKMSQSEALFFLMHSYWLLMEGVDHTPLVEFYSN